MAAKKERKKPARRTSRGSGGARGKRAPASAGKFVWRQPMADAAFLLAVDELPDRDIAAKVGVDPGQIWRWKRHPEFAARVQKHRDELGECAQRYSIGRQASRLKALDDRWQRLQRIIEARAADPEMQKAAGGDTGLLVRQVKAVKVWEAEGRDTADADCVPTKQTTLVEHFAVDTGLLRELREHEKQAAIEIGRWVEKLALTNPDGTDEYSPAGFTTDEVIAILEGLAARLGVAVAGPDS